jgi:endonuclease-3
MCCLHASIHLQWSSSRLTHAAPPPSPMNTLLRPWPPAGNITGRLISTRLLWGRAEVGPPALSLERERERFHDCRPTAQPMSIGQRRPEEESLKPLRRLILIFLGVITLQSSLSSLALFGSPLPAHSYSFATMVPRRRSLRTRADSVPAPGGEESGGNGKRERGAVYNQGRVATNNAPPRSSSSKSSTKGGKRVPRQKKPPAASASCAPPTASERAIRKGEMIRKVLDKLYPDPPIPLDFKDHFTLLCAVMLSAQTTDGKVNGVTPELFSRAPTPKAMMDMDYDDVLNIIRSVGLAPTKAKNLIGAAKRLHDVYGSAVPSSLEELMTLPGVGRKTASVVLAQAFMEPSFPVDTHIHRLALRWGLSKSEKDVGKVEEDLKSIFPKSSWNKLHLQIIYCGREHCPAQGHQPSLCPICSWAGAGMKGDLPEHLDDILQLEHPSPHKRRKNIIWYSDRLAEVKSSRDDVRKALEWRD